MLLKYMSVISNYFKKCSLDNFKIQTVDIEDKDLGMATGIRCYSVETTHHHGDDALIAWMSVQLFVGRINVLQVNPDYRQCGIDRQLLKLAYRDIVNTGKATHLWVTTKDQKDKFWSKIPGMEWRPYVSSSFKYPGFRVLLSDKEFGAFCTE